MRCRAEGGEERDHAQGARGSTHDGPGSRSVKPWTCNEQFLVIDLMMMILCQASQRWAVFPGSMGASLLWGPLWVYMWRMSYFPASQHPSVSCLASVLPGY